MKLPLVSLLLFLLATVVGCGGDRHTYAKVKGTVTYNGKPVDKGEVIFTVEGKPAAVIDIIDGKFAGQAIVGSNRVSVSATKKSATPIKYSKEVLAQKKAYIAQGKGAESGDADYASVEYIPPEWGSASKHVFVVEAGAANDFDFNIKGSN
jgi:hypothetical protein